MIITHIDRQFFKIKVINIAIAAILTRLKVFNDRVAGGMIMIGGMLVLGLVTAAHVTADFAQAQMDPGITHLQAFYAAIPAWCHRVDLLEM
jgi:hypothetical protein